MKAINTLHKMQLTLTKSNLLNRLNWENLQGCDNLINEAIPLLGAFFDDILKKWGTGQHLILTRGGRSYPVYATLNKDSLDPSRDKYSTHKKFSDDTLILHRDDYGSYSLTSRKEGTHINFLPIPGNKLMVSGSKVAGRELHRSKDFDGVKAISLVTLALGKAASKGGTNSAGRIKSTKSWAVIGFDRPEGYKEDTKTILDAYRIVRKHTGYDKSRRTFERQLSAGPLTFNAGGGFTISIFKGRNDPTPNNLLIPMDIEDSDNLKYDAVLLGVRSSPAEKPLSKDGNKQTSAEILLGKVRGELSEEQIMAAVTIFHNIYANVKRKDGLDYLDLNELDYIAWVTGALSGWFRQGLKKGFNIGAINHKVAWLNKKETRK